MYISLGGFFTYMTRSINEEDTFLPMPNEAHNKLLKLIPYDGYSFLSLQDGNAIEFVKITNICGKLVIVRGVEKTNKHYFRCGSIIKFVLCEQGIMDFLCQLENCKGDIDMYVPIAGFRSKLTYKLSDIDTDLPIHEQHLSLLRSRLNDGEYTYLRIYDGDKVEYVKLVNNANNLAIERGLELTTPTTFPIGSCVVWELTPSGVEDIVCQMKCCSSEV